MINRVPRILFAGTGSGCGKTTVTCAVLQALVNRGLKVGAFKCGPDYIDPMFHSRIIGAKSANLDLFFLGENGLRYLLLKNAADCDVSVIEGVMGYYDGICMDTMQYATCHVAQVTKSPTILVINAGGASLSALAILRGFLDFCDDHYIRGVILNQCSAPVYEALVKAVKEYIPDEVEMLGYLPKLKSITLESRHLGLVTAAEVENLKEKMQELAKQAEKTLELDGILRLAQEASAISCKPVVPRKFTESVNIAIAKDKAFCFYYEDNLNMLREMGAQLTEFSPLDDQRLPENVHGLYLGGGYPELYKQALSANITMRKSIFDGLNAQLPCIAECGGFMYLTQRIDKEPMVGFLQGDCYDTGKLTRFGYVNLQAKRDNMLCAAQDSIRGHEFHHWDCTCPGTDCTVAKPTGKTWESCTTNAFLYAGYPHFHFYANPMFAEHFYEACLKEKNRHD